MTLSLTTVWTLAQKELRDALRNRWFLLYTVAFIALSLAFSYLALASSGMVGFAGFGRTAASLINLVLLIVPLMALTVGAQSLSGEMERGTMSYLLAQPVGRVEVFLGKYLGLALSLLASLALGFGVSGLLLALSGSGAAAPGAYITLVLLAFLLSLAMLSVGFLISALTRRASVAVGIGLFLWLAFVFLGDLGMMGTSMALRGRFLTSFCCRCPTRRRSSRWRRFSTSTPPWTSWARPASMPCNATARACWSSSWRCWPCGRPCRPRWPMRALPAEAISDIP